MVARSSQRGAQVILRMRLPREAKSEREGALPAIAALHPLGLAAAFELFAGGHGAELRLHAGNGAVAAVLSQQLMSGYPGSRFDEVAAPVDLPPCTLSASFGMRLPGAVPLSGLLPSAGTRSAQRFAGDSVSGVLSALDEVRPGEQASFQVRLERPIPPGSDAWTLDFLRRAEARAREPKHEPGLLASLFQSPPDPLAREAEQRLADAVRLKAQLPQFEASVRLSVSTATRERTIDLVRNILAPLAASSRPGANELVPVLEGSSKKGKPSLYSVRLSAAEVLGLWHPPLDPSGPGRGCFLRGVDLPLPALPALPAAGVQLGWSSAGPGAQPLLLPLNDLRRHAVFLGASGGGKSTSLLTLMLSLAEQGAGFGSIDVKGDLVDDLMGRIPTHRRRDVHVVDPADPHCSSGIDLFAIARQLDLDLSADFVVSAFQAQFSESWGVAFPRPMKAAIRALLEVHGRTILDLPRMLRDGDFRRAVLDRVADETVRDYFLYEFEPMGRARQLQAVGPALTRIGAALDSSFGRRLFGANNGPGLRELMDGDGILVCRYHGGVLGKQNASLFAGLTAAACQLAAMTRVEMPETQRTNWTLICDEAHDYATASFAETLSLGRGYGLSVVMATQFLNQMPAQVRSSMLANASTLVCFRLGEEDVSLVGRRFEPSISRHELTELSNFTGVVRTSFEGERQPPFTLFVQPPAMPWDAAVAEEVRTHSRQPLPSVSASEFVIPVRQRLQVVPQAPERWDDIEEYEA